MTLSPKKSLATAASAAAAGLAILVPGQAHAALMCTFGTLGSCAGTVGNLTFSNFQTTGSAQTQDSITITLSPATGFYTIVNGYTASASSALTGNGSLTFDITAASGYAFAAASANADLTNGTPANPFTFTSSLTGLPLSLVSTGSNVGPNSFNSGVTSTTATISWSQGATNNEAYNSSLRLTTNPPSIAVPGPLPILGAGAMFGFSRHLRRRVSSSHIS